MSDTYIIINQKKLPVFLHEAGLLMNNNPDYIDLRLLLFHGEYSIFKEIYKQIINANIEFDVDLLILAGAQYISHTRDDDFKNSIYTSLLKSVEIINPVSYTALSGLLSEKKSLIAAPCLSCAFPWGISGIDTADWGEIKRIIINSNDNDNTVLADIRLGNERLSYLTTRDDKVAVLGLFESCMQSHYIEPRVKHELKLPYGRWMDMRVLELEDNHGRCHYTGGAVYLCPALPADVSGSFRMYADGGYIIECIFENGIVVKADITSRFTGQCVVQNPWSHGVVLEKSDGSKESFLCCKFIKWNAQAGETYTLTERTPSSTLNSFSDVSHFLTEGKKHLSKSIWPHGREVAQNPESEIIRVEERENYKLYTIAINSKPDRRIEYLLSIPKGDGIFPLLLGIHGHEATWGVADIRSFNYGSEDDFCVYFADRGYMVVHPPTMDHSLCDNDFDNTLYGYWINDILCCVDDVFDNYDIKNKRYSIVGLSTGAGLAAHVASLDDRVYACVSSGFFITMRHMFFNIRMPPNCACGSDYILAENFTTADYFGLCAPKHLLIMHGRLDRAMFPGYVPTIDEKNDIYFDWWRRPQDKAGFDSEYENLKNIYKSAGFENNVDLMFHDGPHSVNNEIAFEWIEKKRSLN